MYCYALKSNHDAIRTFSTGEMLQMPNKLTFKGQILYFKSKKTIFSKKVFSDYITSTTSVAHAHSAYKESPFS